jgi:small subunit ribosomal protein S9
MASVMFAKTFGRRKTAVANLELVRGLGQIQINGILAENFFSGYPNRFLIANQPFRLFANLIFDAKAKIQGGGLQIQAEALQLSLVRALVLVQPRDRAFFREQKFLTQDSRKKERRKYGLKKARKASQFSKRLSLYILSKCFVNTRTIKK